MKNKGTDQSELICTLILHLQYAHGPSLFTHCPSNFAGNYYEFAPVGPVRAAEPCMDVNLMIQTAKYECHVVYNSMLMNPPVTCR